MIRYNLNTLNLRDFQEAIERGEYAGFPAKDWIDDHKADPIDKAEFFVCTDDGTIFRNPGKCPSPYHPHPRPRPSNRIFQWLIFVPAIIAFIYSVINNETLVNLIVSAFLLIITAIVFTLLLGGVIYVWAKISPESVVRGIRQASHFIALLSAFFSMIIISIIQRQFPPLIWWVIEFVVAFVLESYVTELVARLVFRFVLPDVEFREPDDSLEKFVQECANDMVPPISYRLLFFSSCLSVGFWLFSPALFNNKLPPIWMIPFILTPYVVWVWRFYERFFNLIQSPALIRLVKEDPDVSFKVDVVTSAALATIRPTEVERRTHWWQMLLFYASIVLPPAGVVAAFVYVGY